MFVFLQVGSFANAAVLAKDRNTQYVFLPTPSSHSYTQPYDVEKSSKSWPSASYNERVFLRTTELVKAGEEFLVDYGNGYYRRHGLV